MLAGFEEIQLAEEECEKFARAFVQLAGTRKKKIPPKMLAWGNFLSTAAAIFAPRVIAIAARMASKPKPAVQGALLLVPTQADSSAQKPN
jgi:hypothetical protein